MADEPTGSGGRRRRLDASGPREVVYCHLCSAEWYRSEHGLKCPECESDITEIITPESDPRPEPDELATPPDLRDLRGHNPWQHNASDSDPEEADIEEHVTHGPNGSVFFSQTIRSSRPPRAPFGTHPNPRRRRAFPEDDPDHVMADFQSMLGNLMGPGLRPGQTGRSGGDTLFGQGQFGGNTFRTTHGPNVVGGRFTFTTGPIRPRDAGGPQAGGPPDDLATIIANLFGPMGELGDHDHDHNARGAGMPPPFQNLLASLLNPANARQGDAVYSQEALDQIISTLMEQHPTSNAPGPASPDAISALPKKNVDEKMLGPEGKAECSVCMDDVKIGDEVVSLPCTHWFHEQCAAMWLGEHNTCPICRKGIDSEAAPSPTGRRSSNSNPSPRSERRSSTSRVYLARRMSDRNEARLDFIRNNGRLSPTEATQGSTTGSTRRIQLVGNGLGDQSASFSRPRERDDESDPSRDMPGSFSSFSRYRDERNDGRRESVGRGEASGRRNTSGSDYSRSSRRSSRSGESTGNGPMSWLRDRFGSGRRSHE